MSLKRPKECIWHLACRGAVVAVVAGGSRGTESFESLSVQHRDWCGGARAPRCISEHKSDGF